MDLLSLRPSDILEKGTSIKHGLGKAKELAGGQEQARGRMGIQTYKV